MNDIESWFVEFVNKKQPFESEDINVILRLIGCYFFVQNMDKKIDNRINEEVIKAQNEFYDTIKPYLIITPRN